ncbi:MAG: hypothetical protein AAF628_22045 [Planctomycetota bacterium]
MKRGGKVRLVALGAVAIAVWVWFPKGRPKASEAGLVPAAPRRAAAPVKSGAARGTPSAVATAASTAASMPAPAPIADAGAGAISEAAARDQFGGLLAAVEGAVAAGRLGVACTALTEADAAPSMPAEWRTRCDAAQAKVDAALRERADQLGALVQGGRVLEAATLLATLRESPHERVEAELTRLVRERQWLPFTQSVDDAGRPAAPAALAEGREVRVVHDGDWARGEVLAAAAGADPDEVAVRLRLEGGVKFCFVPRRDVEPIEPSASEAADQAAAALRADAPTLAALWLAVAKDGGLPEAALRSLAAGLGR